MCDIVNRFPYYLDNKYRAPYNFSILKLKLFKEGKEAQEASDIYKYHIINMANLLCCTAETNTKW